MSKDGDYVKMNEGEKAAYRVGLMSEKISPIQEGDNRLSPIFQEQPVKIADGQKGVEININIVKPKAKRKRSKSKKKISKKRPKKGGKRKTRRKKGAKAYGKYRPYVDACKRRWRGTNCTKGFKCQTPSEDYKISPEAAKEWNNSPEQKKIEHMYPQGFLSPDIPLRYHDIYLNGDLKRGYGEKCVRGVSCLNRCIPEKDAEFFYYTKPGAELAGQFGKAVLGTYASLPGKAFAAVGNAAGRGLKSFDKASKRLMKKKEPTEYDRRMSEIDAEERRRKRESAGESGSSLVSNATDAYAGYELGRRVGLIDGDPLQDGIDAAKEEVREGVRSMVAGKNKRRKSKKKRKKRKKKTRRRRRK